MDLLATDIIPSLIENSYKLTCSRLKAFGKFFTVVTRSLGQLRLRPRGGDKLGDGF